jgi:hypothetical protein
MSTAATSTKSTKERSTKEWLPPFFLAVPFAAIVTGLFNLSESLSVPGGLLVGAAWGVVLGLIVGLIRKNDVAAAWFEDVLVVLGATAVAFAAAGGVMALLMLAGALESSTLTGETLLKLFLPTIPFYIVANAALELLIIPGLLFIGWRAGKRRILIIGAAALYFLLRVWTYLAFVPSRMGFAEAGHTSTPLTEAERQQVYTELMLDDPRWIVLLVIFVILVLAMHLPRLRSVGRLPG